MNKKKFFFDDIFYLKNKNNIKIFDFIKNKKKKFLETIDVSINLFIDTKNINQNLIGKVCLPHGIGKNNKVVVFTSDSRIKESYLYGAYFAGNNDLINKIKNNSIEYDVVISTPDLFYKVNKLGQILGPKGLMPNIKLGTVTNNLKDDIKKFINGQIIYKSDKFGIIHSIIGKINFSSKKLFDNLVTLINSIKLNKPSGYKGNIFIKKVFVCSTMGKSYLINLNNI